MKFNSLILSICLISQSLNAQDWFLIVTSNVTSDATIIDITSAEPEVDIAIGNNPLGIAITPDAAFAFIANSDSASVSKIDIAAGTVVATIHTILSITNAPPKIYTPNGVAITPDGAFAYVPAALDKLAGNDVLFKIDLSNNALTSMHFTETDPNAKYIALSPDGFTAYVILQDANLLAVVDLLANTYVTFATDNAPQCLSITPDGLKVFIANNNSVNVFHTATQLMTPVVNYPGLTAPFGVAILKDGSKAYISNIDDDSVSVVDVAMETVLTTISGFNFPQGIAISPDGLLAYVVNTGTSEILTIDTTTDTIVGQPFAIGTQAILDAITPDQAPVAAFTNSSNSLKATFDASSSTTPTGTIATYEWDFGDGSPPVTTNNAMIVHDYALAGNYDVLLTVVNSAGTSLIQTFTGQTVSNNGGPSAQITKAITVSASASPSSPSNLSGNQSKNKFSTQTEIYNTIRWSASTSPSPIVEYRIFRDSGLTDLAGVVSTTQFIDHNRHPKIAYSYYVVAVDTLGNTSAAAFIQVP